MRQGVTLYDSASKAGCDNEILFWVQLKEDSKLILPSYNNLIEAETEKEDGNTVFNFEKLSALINQHSDQIEKMELFINQHAAIAKNTPENCKTFELFGEELNEVAL